MPLLLETVTFCASYLVWAGLFFWAEHATSPRPIHMRALYTRGILRKKLLLKILGRCALNVLLVFALPVALLDAIGGPKFSSSAAVWFAWVSFAWFLMIFLRGAIYYQFFFRLKWRFAEHEYPNIPLTTLCCAPLDAVMFVGLPMFAGIFIAHPPLFVRLVWYHLCALCLCVSNSSMRNERIQGAYMEPWKDVTWMIVGLPMFAGVSVAHPSLVVRLVWYHLCALCLCVSIMTMRNQATHGVCIKPWKDIVWNLWWRWEPYARKARSWKERNALVTKDHLLSLSRDTSTFFSIVPRDCIHLIFAQRGSPYIGVVSNAKHCTVYMVAKARISTVCTGKTGEVVAHCAACESVFELMLTPSLAVEHKCTYAPKLHLIQRNPRLIITGSGTIVHVDMGAQSVAAMDRPNTCVRHTLEMPFAVDRIEAGAGDTFHIANSRMYTAATIRIDQFNNPEVLCVHPHTSTDSHPLYISPASGTLQRVDIDRWEKVRDIPLWKWTGDAHGNIVMISPSERELRILWACTKFSSMTVIPISERLSGLTIHTVLPDGSVLASDAKHVYSFVLE